MYIYRLPLLIFLITSNLKLVLSRPEVELPFNPERKLLPLKQHSPFPLTENNQVRNDLQGRNDDLNKRQMYSQEDLSSWTKNEKSKRQLRWEQQISYEGKTFFDGRVPQTSELAIT
ncbi:uncharacterized protein L201_000371 [Kwoniella dendrophila CBS 6074]|uniref:Uncharacterized protein n=1 Tax=Kwoniella dendrophila CBS 6074 TaxID=1295534 RepID=A0AAX4JJ95_9TREE